MRHTLLAVAVVGQILISSAWSREPEPEAQQAVRAKRLLDAWHAEDQHKLTRQLHLVCWTPADREFPADYQTRLTRIMQHIQAFYAREMQRHGFGERSINLPTDKDGKLILHTVRGVHPAEHYGKASGNEIRTECGPTLQKARIQSNDETVVIFCNLAEWDAEKLQFRHNSPYYAGGSYRKGTAWQLDSPELDVPNLKLKQPLIRDGEYGRISLGKHNSIFIGGIAHELGHALGLPHCKARPDEAARGTALMGSGNRTYGDELRGEGQGTVLSFAHALRLASHPQFSGTVKGFDSKASSTVNDLAVSADHRAIEVIGNVQGEPPVYGVVAYFDPEGGGDYNASTATAVPDADGRFFLKTTALAPGKRGELRLVLLHANGATSGRDLRFSYEVAKDGTPDVSATQMRLELAPFVKAMAARNLRMARELSRKLQHPDARRIAERLLNPPAMLQSPAKLAVATKSAVLSRCKPDSAKVGWRQPTYDRLPAPELLLESNGRIFEQGLYAHAPAEHVYSLGGKWQTLTGLAGIATGHNGSVEFEIRGDGKSLWRSKRVTATDLEKFKVNVQGVQKLELLTHPTADGPGSDWALWLDPTLERE